MKQLVWRRRRICQKTVKYLTIKIRKTSSDVSSLHQLGFPKKVQLKQIPGIFSPHDYPPVPINTCRRQVKKANLRHLVVSGETVVFQIFTGICERL